MELGCAELGLSHVLIYQTLSNRRPGDEQHKNKFSYFHRIIEWFGLEGTLKIIWFQPPCHEQGHLPPDQVVQSSREVFLLLPSKIH